MERKPLKASTKKKLAIIRKAAAARAKAVASLTPEDLETKAARRKAQ